MTTLGQKIDAATQAVRQEAQKMTNERRNGIIGLVLAAAVGYVAHAGVDKLQQGHSGADVVKKNGIEYFVYSENGKQEARTVDYTKFSIGISDYLAPKFTTAPNGGGIGASVTSPVEQNNAMFQKYLDSKK